MNTDFKPRFWQQKAWKDFEKAEYSALLEAPTAAGKTVFAIWVVSRLKQKYPNLKTTIIVPTIPLLRQWKKELLKFLTVSESEIGVYYGGKKDSSLGKKFMIYVVNSASSNDNLKHQQQSNQFDFVIHDEVHHVGAPTYQRLLEITSFKFKLGMSATPDREYDSTGTRRIKRYFKNFITIPNEIVERPPIIYSVIRVSFTAEEKEKYAHKIKSLKISEQRLKKFYGVIPGSKTFFEEITQLAQAGVKDASNYISTLRGMEGMRFTAYNKLRVIKQLAKSELRKKSIIFCDRISFVNKIKQVLKHYYPDRNIYHIHSDMQKRVQIKQLDMFKLSINGILIAARIVDEGFNVPDASIGILVSFTKTKRQSIQRDGRILRFVKGKIAKKIVLMIRDVDEKDYFSVLKKTNQLKYALKGTWYDYVDGKFKVSPEAKYKFHKMNLEHIYRKKSSDTLQNNSKIEEKTKIRLEQI